MSESIISNRRACWVTGAENGLDRHHCFKASRRKHAEEHGLWVWLRHDVHMAMHDHRAPYETLENELKVVAQRAFEESGGTREDFMRVFGANYIVD